MAKKIVVLGGVGSQTISATIDLSKESNFDEIVIADIDIEKANTLASMLEDERITCQKIDATNVDSMVDVMKGCEIIINGLSFIFESTLIEAITKAKVKFMIDVNSLLEIEGEAFDHEHWEKWDKKLKQAGIGTVCFSGGIAITELLAVKAAKEMDRVDEIHCYWGCALPLEHAVPGLLDTVLLEEHPWVAERIYYANGKIIRGVEPLGLLTSWEYPEPIAKHCGKEAYALTHSEPLSLSKIFPDAKMITSRGVLGDKMVVWLQKFLAKYDIYMMAPIEVQPSAFAPESNGVTVTPINFMRSLVLHIAKGELDKIWRGEKEADWQGEYSLEAEVIGIKDGIGARSVYTCLPPPHPWHEFLRKWPPAEFGVSIGVPMSVTACMLLDGDIEMKTGFLSNPELFPDPEKFFNELKKKGFKIEKTV